MEIAEVVSEIEGTPTRKKGRSSRGHRRQTGVCTRRRRRHSAGDDRPGIGAAGAVTALAIAAALATGVIAVLDVDDCVKRGLSAWSACADGPPQPGTKIEGCDKPLEPALGHGIHKPFRAALGLGGAGHRRQLKALEGRDPAHGNRGETSRTSPAARY